MKLGSSIVIILAAVLILPFISEDVYASCVRDAPDVQLVNKTNESVQSGETITYNFNVTNNDNVNCTSASYRMNSETPSASWQVSPTTTSNIENGSSLIVPVDIRSENDIEGHDYDIIINFSHSSNDSLKAQKEVEFIIDEPAECQKGNHLINLVEDTLSGAAGTQKTFKVNITNTDSSCNSVRYNVSGVMLGNPSSGEFSISSPRVSKVQSNTSDSNSFSISVRPDNEVPPGSYDVRFTAKSVSRPVITVDGTYTVSPTEEQLFNLKQGWNLVSSPTDEGISIETIRANCGSDSNAFYFDSKSFVYRKANTLLPYIGYWVKSGGDCSFTVESNVDMPYSVDLGGISSDNSEGWNIVSGSGSWSQLRGDCQTPAQKEGSSFNPATDAWDYIASSNSYTKTNSFDHKRAYWVKINESCTWNVDSPDIEISSLDCRRSGNGLQVQFAIRNNLQSEIQANGIQSSLKQPSLGAIPNPSHSSILPGESKTISHDVSVENEGLAGGYYFIDYEIDGNNIRVASLCPDAGSSPTGQFSLTLEKTGNFVKGWLQTAVLKNILNVV